MKRTIQNPKAQPDPALQARVLRMREQEIKLKQKQFNEKLTIAKEPDIIVWGGDAFKPRSTAYERGLALFQRKVVDVQHIN